MNRYTFHFLSLSLLLIFIFSACQHETPLPQMEEEGVEKYPAEDYFLQRSYPDRKFPLEAYHAALQQARIQHTQRNPANLEFAFPWTTQGPGNIGARINTVAAHPTDEDILYAGFSGGGVFKTTDGGTNWSPIFDDQSYLSIGDIVIDPSDAETIYVGTGDPNISGYPYIGNGLFKSTNGGTTWEHLGLSEVGIIAKVIVHPGNSDIIYVAAMGIPYYRTDDRGLYKTTDGGNTWTKVLFIDNDAGVIDLLLDPSNPDILYASSWNRIRSNSESFVTGPDAGIHKSTDGGATWTELTTGLPTGNQGRIGLAMSGLDSDVIFALYVNTSAQLGGIYKSTNAGTSWTQLPTTTSTGLSSNALGGFGWYFGKLRVDPTNDDRLYILGVRLWSTFNSGTNWTIATPTSGSNVPHVDNHDFVFNFDGDQILATDGGLYKKEFGSLVWGDVENIATTQFYRTAYNPHQPNSYYGGAQDNGTVTGNVPDFNNWDRMLGGDGFQAAFHPTNANIVYAETQRGDIWYSSNGGNSFQIGDSGIEGTDRRHWDMQYIISPHNPNVLYTGTYRPYRSNSTGAPSWTTIGDDLTDGIVFGSSFHTISCLDESPLQEGLLYYGTADGNLWRSNNTGATWDSIHTGLPNRYISSVKASPDVVDRVYVTNSGYRDGDDIPHVHVSNDRGDNWTDISGDLPQMAVNDIIILPGYNGQVLFVATDAGVYGTTSGGNSWERLGTNMPMVKVYDLVWNETNNQVVAATFGRSIMSFPLDSVDLSSSPTLSFSGQILTETGAGVSSVEVNVSGDNNQTVQTDASGNYSLSSLTSGNNCTLTPSKNTNAVNGVSGFDIIKITEHILNVDTLDSPYKIIAADVNASGGVSGIDIVHMRRVILFIQDTFPNNESWRFVQTNYVFPNPIDPFVEVFPEIYDCGGQSGNLTANFVGIKVGDVNGNANPASLTNEIADTQGEPLPLYSEDQILQIGESYRIPINIGQTIGIKGMQFTLRYDPQKISLPDLSGVALGTIPETNMAKHPGGREGVITFSWDAREDIQLEAGATLFELQFTALENSPLKEVLNINSQFTPAELYTTEDTILPLSFSFETKAGATSLSVFPNPLREETQFQFQVEQASTFELRIFDAQGKVHFRGQRTFPEGQQQWDFRAEVLPGNGIYFYRLQSDSKSYTGSLLKVD